jgi:hypothetical protein
VCVWQGGPTSTNARLHGNPPSIQPLLLLLLLLSAAKTFGATAPSTTPCVRLLLETDGDGVEQWSNLRHFGDISDVPDVKGHAFDSEVRRTLDSLVVVVLVLCWC